MPAWRVRTLRTVLERVGEPANHTVIRFGRAAPSPGVAGVREHVIDIPWGSPVLAATPAERLISERQFTLHAWSPSVVPWCLTELSRNRGQGAGARSPLFVDADFPLDPHRLASACREADVVFVAASQSARSSLRSAGVEADRCSVVLPFVDQAIFEESPRAFIRKALGLADHHFALLLAPPPSADSGGLLCAWAGLLVHHMLPALRLIIPSGCRGLEQIEKLVMDGERPEMLRVASPNDADGALLGACDGCAWLPSQDATCDGVAMAMASGRPIVATAISSVAEFLTHDVTARLVGEPTPRAVARRILEMIEDPDQSRRLGFAARRSAFECFGRQSMVEQFEAVYQRFAAK